MPYKDYNQTKELTRQWKAENPEGVKSQKTRYYQLHKEEIQNRYKQYYLEHKDKIDTQRRTSRLKAKLKYKMAVINALGGQCIICGFSDFRALHIHHKEGGGTQERRKYGNGAPINDYRYLRGLFCQE